MTEPDEPLPGPAEVAKYQSFLTERLLPDLKAATAEQEALQRESEQYEQLAKTLSGRFEGKDVETVSELGEGFALRATIPSTEHAFVSLGLGGFYAQLTKPEALAFIDKKRELLAKRLQRADAKVGQIEAHIHLASTSLEQLEKLRRGTSMIESLNI